MNKSNVVATNANKSILAYDPFMQAELSAEYTENLAYAASEILLGNKVLEHITASELTARFDMLKIARKLDMEMPETAVHEKAYAKTIAMYSEQVRAQLWEYRRIAIRIVSLTTLTNESVNKKKFSFRLTRSISAILDVILTVGGNQATESQMVHRLSSILKVDQYVTKDGAKRKANAWVVDELALTLLSELAEMDILGIQISHKTHMVSFDESQDAKLDKTELQRMSLVANFLKLKTILTSPATIGKSMISSSSWWYQTPKFSADQQLFVEVMYSMKFEFVENAEDLIAEAYRNHLDVEVLEAHHLRKVEEFKRQIRASHANGGHYVAGKFDSALRWYFLAEIGHFQTSKALRALVKTSAINKPVKYDFRNNVVQMYSVLTGMKSLAKFVGLTPDDQQLGDLRALIATDMNTECGVTSFTKDNIKPLFMIWAYNAGKKRLLNGEYITETDFLTGHVRQILKTPGLIELSGGLEGDTLWSAWESILNRLVPGIVALKALFRKLLKGNPLTEVEWLLPDDAVAQYASVETVSETLHWVTSSYKAHSHTHYRKEIVEGVKNTGLLPRIIHSFDAYVMRQLIIRAAALGITMVPNHDSFIFDEIHMDTVNGLVNDIFTELLDSDALSDVISQLNVERVDLTLKDAHRKVITIADFGEQLAPQDIIDGRPMDQEEM